MQNRTFHIFLFLCIAAIGGYATIAQVLLIREFLNVFMATHSVWVSYLAHGFWVLPQAPLRAQRLSGRFTAPSLFLPSRCSFSAFCSPCKSFLYAGCGVFCVLGLVSIFP
ncbi:MAG: hypothetical protein L3J18_16410 [Candidatus Brocadia sp.]|nr:MAG: hypothetical protein L3J18_16410 [Candidatus Brocadia sp.]